MHVLLLLAAKPLEAPQGWPLMYSRPLNACLLQGNAVPLAIFLLGLEEQGQQLEQRDSAGPPLDSAKPALCGMLQRLGEADPGGGAPLLPLNACSVQPVDRAGQG